MTGGLGVRLTNQYVADWLLPLPIKKIINLFFLVGWINPNNLLHALSIKLFFACNSNILYADMSPSQIIWCGTQICKSKDGGKRSLQKSWKQHSCNKTRLMTHGCYKHGWCNNMVAVKNGCFNMGAIENIRNWIFQFYIQYANPTLIKISNFWSMMQNSSTVVVFR